MQKQNHRHDFFLINFLLFLLKMPGPDTLLRSSYDFTIYNCPNCHATITLTKVNLCLRKKKKILKSYKKKGMLWKMLSSQVKYVWFVVIGLAQSCKTCKNTDMVYMAEQLCWFTAVPKKAFLCSWFKIVCFPGMEAHYCRCD